MLFLVKPLRKVNYGKQRLKRRLLPKPRLRPTSWQLTKLLQKPLKLSVKQTPRLKPKLKLQQRATTVLVMTSPHLSILTISLQNRPPLMPHPLLERRNSPLCASLCSVNRLRP